MKKIFCFVIFVFVVIPLVASEVNHQEVATFSVVGFDPETGDLGVAVQSKFIAVGAVVPWAKSGVGAIATQAWGNTTYGPEGLRLLEEGKSPEEVLKILTDKDIKKEGENRGGKEARQVGIVDGKGRSVTFTGRECLDWAGGISGENFAVQGNILVGPEVVEAMAKAFKETKGELADKLLATIEAGQYAGGDSRGRQSAALLVVRKGGGYSGFNDRYIDLRVDDHAGPVQELKRIYRLYMKTMHQKRVLGDRILYYQYGSDIEELEKMLFKLGYLEEEPDDTFKETTEKALRKFRKKHGMDDKYGYADQSVINILKEEAERAEK